MANQRTGTTSKHGAGSRSGTAAKKRSNTARNRRPPESPLHQDLTLIALVAGMIFLFLSNFGILGPIGNFFSGLQFGLFGFMAYFLPIFAFAVILYKTVRAGEYDTTRKVVSAIILFLLVSILCELISGDLKNVTEYDLVGIYQRCAETKRGGGVLAGSIAYFLYALLKMFGTILVVLIAGAICAFLLTDRSISDLIEDGMNYQQERSELRKDRREEMMIRREEELSRREELRERRSMEQRARREEERQRREEQRARREEERALREEEWLRMEEEERLEREQLEEEYRLQKLEQERLIEEEENDRILNPNGIVVKGSYADPETEEAMRSGNSSLGGKNSDSYTDDEEDSYIDYRQEKNNMHEILAEEDLYDEDEAYPDEEIGSGENDDREPVYAHPIELNPRPAEGETDIVSDIGNGIHEITPAQDQEGSEIAPDSEYYSDTDDENSDSVMNGQAHADILAFPGGLAKSRLNEIDESDNSFESVPANVTSAAADIPTKATGSAGSEVSPDEEDLEAIQVHREDATTGESAESRIGMKSDAVRAGGDGAESETAEPSGSSASAAALLTAPVPKRVPRKYVFPPMELLKEGTSNHNQESERELQETAYRLQETLRTFDVNVKITDISQGPTVTRYELQPDVGVKVSKIVGLQDDIKLALAAADIRIEAPIPGKSAIGIEVPNKTTSVVALRDILDTPEFEQHKSRVSFAVGKDLGGAPIVGDIAKMPHMLIAGSTGSGKSVCINCIIMSILYKAKPDEVKLVMIDPKIVELSVYNGIPHLLVPVVTEAKKASATLNWAVAEMEHRYRLFEEQSVRDIKGYNAKVEQLKESGAADDSLKKMPQMVIIVDELADLMMVAKNDVETSICRLAQLARAAGMHLIIATQRPSVDVITGLIKANMPSRIAFMVSSGVDSRTILDMYGAEKLLGKGDMLFFPQGFPKPARIQGAFVSDDEVTAVVSFIKNRNPEDPAEKEEQAQLVNAMSSGSAAGGTASESAEEAAPVPGGDEYFIDAGRFIIEKNNASIGLLQRRFKIGFNRAARIMDELCEHGVVSESEGTKPRKVLMSIAEFEDYVNNEL